MDVSAFPLYQNSICTLIQAFVYISIGALADHGNLRKRLLILSTLLAVFSVFFLLLVVEERKYWLASIIILISGIFGGISYVFYFAYMPIITHWHPEVVAFSQHLLDQKELSQDDKSRRYLTVFELVGSRISNMGIGLGFLSTLITMLMCLGIIYSLKQSVFS